MKYYFADRLHDFEFHDSVWQVEIAWDSFRKPAWHEEEKWRQARQKKQ